MHLQHQKSRMSFRDHKRPLMRPGRTILRRDGDHAGPIEVDGVKAELSFRVPHDWAGADEGAGYGHGPCHTVEGEGPRTDACSGNGRTLGHLQSVSTTIEESLVDRMWQTVELDLGNTANQSSGEVTEHAGATRCSQLNGTTTIVNQRGKGQIQANVESKRNCAASDWVRGGITGVSPGEV